MKRRRNVRLRLWPGIVILIFQWLIRFALPALVPGDTITQAGIFGGLIGGFAIVLWWMFFSRASLIDRLGAIVLMVMALIATSTILHVSLKTANMGLMFIIFSIPVLSLAFVIWAIATRNLSNGTRRVTMVVTILIASGFWALLRTDGMDGEAHQYLAWRWAKTAEDRLLSAGGQKLTTLAPDSAEMAKTPEWPGFRGFNRDGIVHGVRIGTDWIKSPPVELWRKPVGPGCSSFAIHGNYIYTQEQRGEFEMVSCYTLNTGEPVWTHSDKARFWDSHAGPGPRSTPTILKNRVYTLGGTGILNVLDAYNGNVIWSRNAANDAGVTILPWGFTSSPLVVGNEVIVALSGKLAAFSEANGEPIWSGPDGGNSYSSPHLIEIDSISQVLLMSKSGALSVDPANGKTLWRYDWPVEDRILQPAFIGEGDLLLTAESKGISRISVASSTSGEWKTKEVWFSDQMKLNFNDFIIHKGYAYGFDGPSIACLDISDGKRIWKGSPYRGWLLLLADQDLLLVLTEKGDLTLVEAKPDQFREVARVPGISGKTWNHPAIAGDVLVIRNSREMAAFRLSTAF